jgi:hypothetical protein
LRLPESGPVLTLGGATSLAEIGLFIVRLPYGAGALALGQKLLPVPSPA